MQPLRKWTVPVPKVNLVVGMGEMLVSNDVNSTLLTYSLGSCVAVVIYDPSAKVGGLLHAMLPDSAFGSERAAEKPLMFIDTGLPALFHAVYALGGSKSRLIVKLAGGASVLNESKFLNVAQRNIEAVKALLARNGVRIDAEDIGGTDIRTVRLELATGSVQLDVTGKGSRKL
ncbi:MAG: chemotaxis protein CheD [Verrucomicrobiota bacterium]